MENFKTAIYCQAIGDAFGAPFEFEDPTRRDVRDWIKSDTPMEYTDDTQLTLAVAYGLTTPGGVFGSKYQMLEWFKNQGKPRGIGGLVQFRDYRAVRAPGVNTYKVLAARECGNINPTIGDSNGNGTIMRTLPYALYDLNNDHSHFELALDRAISDARYTHGGDEIETATNAYLEYALRGAIYCCPKELYIQSGGRTAIDCVIRAVSAVRFSKSFEDCMVECIAHEGDSDTIAAVAGGLWALRRGKPKNFDKYVARLTGRDAIEFAITAWESRYGS